jgi:hypothetical protein
VASEETVARLVGASSWRRSRVGRSLVVHGCIEHFRDGVVMRREDLDGLPGTAARFVIVPDR